MHKVKLRNRAVGYRTVFFTTVRYRTVFSRTVGYRTVFSRTVGYRTMFSGTVRYRTVFFGTVRCRTVSGRSGAFLILCALRFRMILLITILIIPCQYYFIPFLRSGTLLHSLPAYHSIINGFAAVSLLICNM
jgi:hypothetical protein